MLAIFRMLVFGHVHHWKEDSRVPLHANGAKVGVAVYCTCTKCGTPKRFELD